MYRYGAVGTRSASDIGNCMRTCMSILYYNFLSAYPSSSVPHPSYPQHPYPPPQTNEAPRGSENEAQGKKSSRG